MPLQNRVDPWGHIHAVSAWGTMMGNRGGKFHRPNQTLGKRRWASPHWICCELHYKNWHHEPMGEGYTSLFFLDEVTALAAGHRPCFLCRNKDARTFLGDERVATFDRRVREEQKRPRPAIAITEVADGTMVEIEGRAFARKGPRLLRWSFAGYDAAISHAEIGMVRLLTPPAIAAILASGYQPRWHNTQKRWEQA